MPNLPITTDPEIMSGTPVFTGDAGAGADGVLSGWALRRMIIWQAGPQAYLHR
jgi:hypothetical protein